MKVYTRDERPLNTTHARRAVYLPIRPRPIVVNGKQWASYDAHELLDALSEAEPSRPGRLTWRSPLG